MKLSGKIISQNDIKNYQTSLTIQKLEERIACDESVRDTFLEEGDYQMANEMQNDVARQTWKMLALRKSISNRMNRILDEYKFVLKFADNGSSHFYELQAK